jgi:hypothetical protein
VQLGWSDGTGEFFEIKQVQYKPTKDALGRVEAVDVVTKLTIADAEEVLRFLTNYLPEQKKKVTEAKARVTDQSEQIKKLREMLEALERGAHAGEPR